VLREADAPDRKPLSGRTIIDELFRNMEAGQFELAYTVLLPCVFRLYINPEDHARLAGVMGVVIEDARKALSSRVAELNRQSAKVGRWRSSKAVAKEYKIACKDWVFDLLPESEVPVGDVEIHSDLNEKPQPGYEGIRTTVIGHEPSVSRLISTAETRRFDRVAARRDQVYAAICYEDDSGPQTYFVTQPEIHVGRGGGNQPMDLALYASDEVSREHLLLRRDAATGTFVIIDQSTNGTWVNGRRLKRGVEETLPEQAQIQIAEVVTLGFEVRK
jgi:hypothetical protein